MQVLLPPWNVDVRADEEAPVMVVAEVYPQWETTPDLSQSHWPDSLGSMEEPPTTQGDHPATPEDMKDCKLDSFP